MKNSKSTLFYCSIGLLLVLMDQLVKWWMISYHPSLILTNKGIIFGFIENPIISYLLLAIGVVFLVWMIKNQSSVVSYRLSVMLITAGAVSNLIDRIFRGYIIDYIHFFNLNVFNLADIFIIAGVLLYAWIILNKK